LSAKAAALVKGGLNTMTFANVKIALAFLLGLGTVGAGAVGLSRQQLRAVQVPSPPRADQAQALTPEQQKAANEQARAQQAEEAVRKALAAQQARKAGAPNAKPAKSDDVELRGTWTAVSYETRGKPLPTGAIKGYRLRFTEGKATAHFAGESKEG